MMAVCVMYLGYIHLKESASFHLGVKLQSKRKGQKTSMAHEKGQISAVSCRVKTNSPREEDLGSLPLACQNNQG